MPAGCVIVRRLEGVLLIVLDFCIAELSVHLPASAWVRPKRGVAGEIGGTM